MRVAGSNPVAKLVMGGSRQLSKERCGLGELPLLGSFSVDGVMKILSPLATNLLWVGTLGTTPKEVVCAVSSWFGFRLSPKPGWNWLTGRQLAGKTEAKDWHSALSAYR